MKLLRFLDRMFIVLAMLMVVGNLGSFELEQITFREFLSYAIVETTAGLLFAMIGLEGLAMSLLRVAQEALDTYKGMKNARCGSDHRRAKI